MSSYGIVEIAESLGDGVYRVKDLVEKPKREDAPSNLAIIGRYILTPDIFPALEATRADRTGEIQLTNGLRRLLQDRPIYACEVKGVRHDTGNKLGFLKAVVYFALRRPDLAERVQGVLSRRLAICDDVAMASDRRSWLGSTALGSPRPTVDLRADPARVSSCFLSLDEVVEGEEAAGVEDALLALLASLPDAGVLEADWTWRRSRRSPRRPSPCPPQPCPSPPRPAPFLA